MPASKIDKLGEDLVSTAREGFRDNLRGLVLFGSIARGEVDEHSDIDLLVILHELPKNPVERRRMVYLAMAPIREKYRRDTTVIEMTDDEAGEVTPLILNIAAEGIILYDEGGELSEFLDKVRRRIEEMGLLRYRTRDGKYGWKLRRPLRPGEVFEIEVSN